MKMMPCTAQIKDGRLCIGIPKTAFVLAIEDFRERTDAKVRAPAGDVLEIRDIVVEVRENRRQEYGI